MRTNGHRMTLIVDDTSEKVQPSLPPHAAAMSPRTHPRTHPLPSITHPSPSRLSSRRAKHTDSTAVLPYLEDAVQRFMAYRPVPPAPSSPHSTRASLPSPRPSPRTPSLSSPQSIPPMPLPSPSNHTPVVTAMLQQLYTVYAFPFPYRSSKGSQSARHHHHSATASGTSRTKGGKAKVIGAANHGAPNAHPMPPASAIARDESVPHASSPGDSGIATPASLPGLQDDVATTVPPSTSASENSSRRSSPSTRTPSISPPVPSLPMPLTSVAPISPSPPHSSPRVASSRMRHRNANAHSPKRIRLRPIQKDALPASSLRSQLRTGLKFTPALQQADRHESADSKRQGAETNTNQTDVKTSETYDHIQSPSPRSPTSPPASSPHLEHIAVPIDTTAEHSSDEHNQMRAELHEYLNSSSCTLFRSSSLAISDATSPSVTIHMFDIDRMCDGDNDARQPPLPEELCAYLITLLESDGSSRRLAGSPSQLTLPFTSFTAFLSALHQLRRLLLKLTAELVPNATPDDANDVLLKLWNESQCGPDLLMRLQEITAAESRKPLPQSEHNGNMIVPSQSPHHHQPPFSSMDDLTQHLSRAQQQWSEYRATLLDFLIPSVSSASVEPDSSIPLPHPSPPLLLSPSEAIEIRLHDLDELLCAGGTTLTTGIEPTLRCLESLRLRLAGCSFPDIVSPRHALEEERLHQHQQVTNHSHIVQADTDSTATVPAADPPQVGCALSDKAAMDERMHWGTATEIDADDTADEVELSNVLSSIQSKYAAAGQLREGAHLMLLRALEGHGHVVASSPSSSSVAEDDSGRARPSPPPTAASSSLFSQSVEVRASDLDALLHAADESLPFALHHIQTIQQQVEVGEREAMQTMCDLVAVISDEHQRAKQCCAEIMAVLSAPPLRNTLWKADARNVGESSTTAVGLPIDLTEAGVARLYMDCMAGSDTIIYLHWLQAAAAAAAEGNDLDRHGNGTAHPEATTTTLSTRPPFSSMSGLTDAIRCMHARTMQQREQLLQFFNASPIDPSDPCSSHSTSHMAPYSIHDLIPPPSSPLPPVHVRDLHRFQKQVGLVDEDGLDNMLAHLQAMAHEARHSRRRKLKRMEQLDQFGQEDEINTHQVDSQQYTSVDEVIAALAKRVALQSDASYIDHVQLVKDILDWMRYSYRGFDSAPNDPKMNTVLASSITPATSSPLHDSPRSRRMMSHPRYKWHDVEHLISASGAGADTLFVLHSLAGDKKHVHTPTKADVVEAVRERFTTIDRMRNESQKIIHEWMGGALQLKDPTSGPAEGRVNAAAQADTSNVPSSNAQSPASKNTLWITSSATIDRIMMECWANLPAPPPAFCLHPYASFYVDLSRWRSILDRMIEGKMMDDTSEGRSSNVADSHVPAPSFPFISLADLLGALRNIDAEFGVENVAKAVSDLSTQLKKIPAETLLDVESGQGADAQQQQKRAEWTERDLLSLLAISNGSTDVACHLVHQLQLDASDPSVVIIRRPPFTSFSQLLDAASHAMIALHQHSNACLTFLQSETGQQLFAVHHDASHQEKPNQQTGVEEEKEQQTSLSAAPRTEHRISANLTQEDALILCVKSGAGICTLPMLRHLFAIGRSFASLLDLCAALKSMYEALSPSINWLLRFFASPSLPSSSSPSSLDAIDVCKLWKPPETSLVEDGADGVRVAHAAESDSPMIVSRVDCMRLVLESRAETLTVQYVKEVNALCRPAQDKTSHLDKGKGENEMEKPNDAAADNDDSETEDEETQDEVASTLAACPAFFESFDAFAHYIYRLHHAHVKESLASLHSLATARVSLLSALQSPSLHLFGLAQNGRLECSLSDDGGCVVALDHLLAAVGVRIKHYVPLPRQIDELRKMQKIHGVPTDSASDLPNEAFLPPSSALLVPPSTDPSPSASHSSHLTPSEGVDRCQYLLSRLDRGGRWQFADLNDLLPVMQLCSTNRIQSARSISRAQTMMFKRVQTQTQALALNRSNDSSSKPSAAATSNTAPASAMASVAIRRAKTSYSPHAISNLKPNDHI